MRIRLLLVIVFQITFGNLLFADNNALHFYSDLAHSISSVSGNVDLYFSSGYWTKTQGPLKIIFLLSDHEKANFKFSYSGGSLQNGSRIAFSPGIHVWVKSQGAGLSCEIDTLFFDDNGICNDWRVKYDHPGTDNLNLVPKIQDAFRLDFKSESLFDLQLFKNLKGAKRSDGKGNVTTSTTNTPMLASIIIKKPSDTEPGLAVSFIPNSTIRLSSQLSRGTFDNVFQLSTGSFEIRYLEYDVANQSIDCEISQFNVTIQSGVFQNADLLLNLGASTSLSFDRVHLYKNDNATGIDTHGALNTQIGSGTRMNLYKTAKYPALLVFESGELNLFDFSYSCDDEKQTTFSIGGGSTLKVATRSGSIPICNNNGYLSINTGRLEAALNGNWNSQEPNPDAHLTISLLQTTLDGGYMPLAGNNIVAIKSGYVNSEHLQFDGRDISSASGSIKDLNIVLADQSKFALPGSINFTTKAGSVINGATPNNPLVFDAKSNYVSGIFDFNIQYVTLYNSPDQTIALHNGNLRMALSVISPDTIRGNDINFDGTTTISAASASLNAHFAFTDGTFNLYPSQQPYFSSKFSLQLLPGNPISFQTPFLKQDDHDIRLFPLNLTLNLTAPVTSPTVNFTVSGRSVHLDTLNMTPLFTLIVPPGKGEHEDKDDINSANGNNGPDWSRACQEVFYLHSGLPPCDAHLYIFPQTISLASSLQLSISNSIISFNFSKVAMNQAFAEDVNWKKDGCNLPVIGGVIGVVTGMILFGDLGATIGGIAGVAAGIRLDHLAEDYVNTQVAALLTKINYSKQWRIL